MNNLISFLTGINDPDLKLDVDGLEETKNLKIIHLIKSGVCHCPVCGHKMLKNGFRQQEVRVKALPIANVPTVLLIRKQKYICPSMPDCPKVVTKLAEIDGIDRNCRITNNIKQAVILDLPKNESQKDIAQDHQVSPSTVGRIIDSLDNNFTPTANWLP